MRAGTQSHRAAWREPVGDLLRVTGAIAFAIVVAVAPLLAGTVHRGTISAVTSAVALCLVALVAGEALRGGHIRGSRASVPFALAALLPALQILPLPTSFRGWFDPGGVALLANAPDGLPRFWPLSLDPTSTRREIVAAVATWMVFLLALHLSSGRRTRLLCVRLLGLVGVVALLSGLAHRIFDISNLFGIFAVEQVLPGPFINPNHVAELYELCAFCSLAMAAATEREVRWAWLLATVVEAAAALTTLSRGSLLALLAGGAVFGFLFLRRERRVDLDEAMAGSSDERVMAALARTSARRSPWVWVAGGGLLLAAGFSVAVALGATPLWDELAHTNLQGSTEKVQLWRDAWAVVKAHPWGIGRGAFEAVYPATKTLAVPVRFQFAENLPLQVLIDVGWFGAALLLGGIYLLWRKINWRRDLVEAALLSGLVAVLAHNFVDFGLETLGMRLPFAAVAGIVVGRGYGRGGGRSFREEPQVAQGAETRRPRPRFWELGFLLATLVSLAIGLPAVWSPRAEDLWAAWQETVEPTRRHELAEAAARRYPTSHLFPLLTSFDEPLVDTNEHHSPRLAALNRALRLCPSCSVVSRTSAQVLGALGRRSQALAAYRDAIRAEPGLLPEVLEEASGRGYRARDLASLVGDTAQSWLTVTRFLIAHRPVGAAPGSVVAMLAEETDQALRGLFADADLGTIPPLERLLVEASWAEARQDYAAASTLLTRAKQMSPRDARPFAALSRIENLQHHAEKALSEIRTAVTLSPLDVELARSQAYLVLQMQKWNDFDRALEQLKMALRQSGAGVAEVHLLSGQAYEARGNIGRASLEYHTVTLVDPANVAGWSAVARLAEGRGDLDGASAALEKILALVPGDQNAVTGLKRLEAQKTDARLRQLLPAGPGK